MAIDALAVAALKALVVLSVLILLIGLIKPKWVLFWMKKPDRLLVTIIALPLFMAAFTGYTELTVKPKPKTEKQRNLDEINELNLGSNPRR
ncbi:MAG: hypothetical protein PHE55_17115 [Methylococcaceae bacterium]|nr:hypothetical protein [Methylococcaceae bacterium]